LKTEVQELKTHMKALRQEVKRRNQSLAMCEEKVKVERDANVKLQVEVGREQSKTAEWQQVR
jgi:hypothetical protein